LLILDNSLLENGNRVAETSQINYSSKPSLTRFSFYCNLREIN
jgi:hypothetical protein